MTARTAAHTKRQKQRMPWWQETILLLILALVVSAIVKAFFVQMFFVPSASMRPLFVEDDRILVEKVSYWNDDPQRGDVVVFKDPGGRWLGAEGAPRLTTWQKLLSDIGLYPTSGHLVKRVIGVGGDHVVCCDHRGRITVNGVPLDEKAYLPPGTEPSDMRFDVHVPPNHLWVMGDNRGNSADSRAHRSLPGHGFVPVNDVTGRVWAIVWPVDHFQVLHDPKTFAQPGLTDAAH
ncbi:MAG TPA: signal peptidase I [Nocardioidaceae bacterium]|jgi:signal peptidase I